jgi:hypothetical protein
MREYFETPEANERMEPMDLSDASERIVWTESTGVSPICLEALVLWLKRVLWLYRVAALLARDGWRWYSR